MPVVAITREMGSLGNEVAQGLGSELGLPVIYHEVIDHLADRMRVRRSHVIRLLDGHAGLLERLTAAENFERFLDKKYTGTKRFGLDGGEALMPAMEQVLKRGTQLGLKEVARIQAGMDKTMRESGFKGTFPEFLAFLRTDPQFIARNPDDLLGVSAYAAKRVDGKLEQYFDVLPRRRFTIIPVPEALAPFYTAGRGGLESCQMNTYNLPVRPLYNIPVLTLHECAPGHSFQAALAEEGKQLPRFRRNIYFSGYGEGWGLYTEYLGIEMGIYRTPYERFGQQSYEMWRAARLVIDTGLHRYGWSRKQAVDYLASHTALSTHEVGTEVDRYISWPGQALAYKLGELTIRRMRAEAEKELGTKFDIKKFHSMLLGLGSVPLPELEAQVRAFIATNKAAKS